MLEQTVNEMQSDLIKMRQASAQVQSRPCACRKAYRSLATWPISLQTCCPVTQCIVRNLRNP